MRYQSREKLAWKVLIAKEDEASIYNRVMEKRFKIQERQEVETALRNTLEAIDKIDKPVLSNRRIKKIIKEQTYMLTDRQYHRFEILLEKYHEQHCKDISQIRYDEDTLNDLIDTRLTIDSMKRDYTFTFIYIIAQIIAIRYALGKLHDMITDQE